MSVIIAARFTAFSQGEAAAQRLFAQGFCEEDVTLFYVNPSGQHDRLPMGGDHHANAGAKDAAKGAGKGVTIGAVAGAIVGAALFTLDSAPWLASVVAAGVGAYVGSLAGAVAHARSGKQALANTTDSGNHGSANAVDARRAGVVVAVHASPETQSQVAILLREAGGMEVERASGRWQNGQWADFDALKPPQPIETFEAFEGRHA
jgi:hypothetical protein